eukprot:CAMPEP_0205899528 /NCGR_PEP_ID=MMETSP1083-20121108/26652_1 /ASSEMBLY_ACC=CAM_ASM_000430 /TAXON_ID=97485 /ORGANISM="Prymnesium parvum, Strain Texoma1" /LENGTH=101 /DNA_ID=CAMNT_0053264907 /DNA_START=159 /DNA_END=461 /DNA_ORIENTATION=-
MNAILHQSIQRTYGSVLHASPDSTINGRQPPAAPIATYSVIFGVDTKSPGAAKQNRWPIAFWKYSREGRFRVAAAMSGNSSVKLTRLYDLHCLMIANRPRP